MGIERFAKREPLESSEPLSDIPPVPPTKTMSFGMTKGGPTMVTLPAVDGLADLVAALRSLEGAADEGSSNQAKEDALRSLARVRAAIEPES